MLIIFLINRFLVGSMKCQEIVKNATQFSKSPKNQQLLTFKKLKLQKF